MTSIAAIIVTWNRESETERTINSILAQELPDHVTLRILVLDDGSTDNTEKLLRDFTQSDSQMVAWRSKTNHRPAIGRNILLNMVEEEFVFFLDSDAWLQSTNALSAFVEFLSTHPDHLAVAGTIWSDENHEKDPFLLGGYLTPMLHADLPRWRTESADPHFLSSCCSLWRTEPI